MPPLISHLVNISEEGDSSYDVLDERIYHRRFGYYRCEHCEHEWASAQTRCYLIGCVFQPVENGKQACRYCMLFLLPYKTERLKTRTGGDFRCECGREWHSINVWIARRYDGEGFELIDDSKQICHNCNEHCFPNHWEQPTGTGGGNRAHMKEYCELCLRGQLCTNAKSHYYAVEE